VTLLTGGARLTMPPEPLEDQRHAAITDFFQTRTWRETRTARLVPARASNQPAFACNNTGPHAPTAHARNLIALTPASDKISAITRPGGNSLPPTSAPRPCPASRIPAQA
jgi:hypothetical protein